MKFIEAAPFTRKRPRLMTDGELGALLAHLAQHPQAGDPIPGTNGLRKVRWANSQRQKGKRSGSRTIYLHIDLAGTIHLLTIYDHEERGDLSAADKRALAHMARDLKQLAKKARGKQ
ncbi:MAG: hypothetical protein PF961_14060 [Planctomycetota bacterium]|jgi:hypothetical protein|nr:hypothetical protein [Planctomycetota bacterium]